MENWELYFLIGINFDTEVLRWAEKENKDLDYADNICYFNQHKDHDAY
jgi:hypothetical protein